MTHRAWITCWYKQQQEQINDMLRQNDETEASLREKQNIKSQTNFSPPKSRSVFLSWHQMYFCTVFNLSWTWHACFYQQEEQTWWLADEVMWRFFHTVATSLQSWINTTQDKMRLAVFMTAWWNRTEQNLSACVTVMKTSRSLMWVQQPDSH